MKKRPRWLTNLQVTEVTKYCFGRNYLMNYQWITNARKKAHAIKKSMFYMRTLHVYICVSIYTLPRMLKGFPTCFYKCQAILWHDCMNVRIFPDGKYSLLGCCSLMLYYIIYRGYVDLGNLSCLSLFLLLSI